MTEPTRTRLILSWPVAACIVALAGCTHRIKVDPITVEPIHLTLDIHLKVDRELDEFFDFENEPAPADDAPEASEPGAPT